MAANIDVSGGRAAFFGREPAWHGLGQVVDRPVNSEEVLDLAGLNWEVNELPIYRGNTPADGPIEGYKCLVRSDTDNVLGVVPRTYRVLQNRKLLEFFSGLSAVSDNLVWETAGSLGLGETVWGMVHIPDLGIKLGRDESKVYLLASNGHTGNRMLRIYPTMIRVVCANTLRMSEVATVGRRRSSRGWDISQGFAVRHTSGMDAALRDIQGAYAKTIEMTQKSQQAAELLASKRLTDELFEQIVKRSFSADADAVAVGELDESSRANAIAEARMERLNQILASPTCQVADTKDTLWSGVQAVIEYVDYDRRTRSTGRGSSQMMRFESAQFGQGAKIKSIAMDTALTLAAA
jgi:phage/plasmid-like protein (TIGR03299 family)